jgi:hypothetical protein
MLDQIKEFVAGIPKPVLFAVVLLVLVAGFFIWKKVSSKDSENEVEKGQYAAVHFAKEIQEGLDKEDAPVFSALNPNYAAEIQQGLADLENETKPVVGAVDPSEDVEDDLADYE